MGGFLLLFGKAELAHTATLTRTRANGRTLCVVDSSCSEASMSTFRNWTRKGIWYNVKNKY